MWKYKGYKEKFLSKIEKTKSGCWLWNGHISKTTGYGRNGPKSAHRVSFEFFKGKIPDGLQLDHLCRVRHCVNPDHLEPVSAKENVNRGIRPSQLRNKKICDHGHFDQWITKKSGYRYCGECARISDRKRRPSKRKSV